MLNYGNANLSDPYSIEGMISPTGGGSPGITPQDAGLFGVGTQMVGGIMSVIGAFYSAQGQRRMLQAQADIAKINAATAESSARTALMIGQREEQRSMLQTAALKGKQTASMAANGIDLGEGSAARVLTDSDVMGQIDRNTIAANAVRQAWGYRTQAVNLQNDASIKESQAGAISPWMGAASSLLTSAGSVAGSWYSLNKGG